MSPEAQRIAIAQACGWTRVYSPGGGSVPFGLHPIESKRNPRALDHLPDYLSDLNAMHEAEKTMTAKDGIPWKYNDCIERLMREEWERNDFEPECLNFWSAPAHIRAEAYVKTLGLWKEEA